MKQIAQNYKTGELSLLDVPVPACRPGGVIVRTAFSLISPGTEMMKVSESKLSLLGKARARPDQVKKVVHAIRQQGVTATYRKVINHLDSYTPLGYSLAGEIVEVGAGVGGLHVGEHVACAGNQYALHADYNWVPRNLCVPVPADVSLEQAACTTVAAIALQGLRQSEIRLGEITCVIGLGLLGQILVRLLRTAGASVVGLDIVVERCRLAEAAGAKFCAVPDPSGYAALSQAVSALSGGHGADCIFICAGGDDNRPAEMAVELARDRARIIDIGKCRLDLPWNGYYGKELELRFSRSYGPGRYDSLYEEAGIDYPIGYVRWTERRNLECILALLADGSLDLSSLITDVVPFDDAVQVYERMNRGSSSSVGVLFRYQPDLSPTSRIINTRVRQRSGDRVRLGVIGAGNYASSMLLPHLATASDVAMIEVVTNSALSAATAAKKFGFARCSTDSAGLLASADIDAVLIATRHASHARLVCDALRAGKAVFVEKPLAIEHQSLGDVIATVRDTGNDRLMVGFNRRFSPLLDQLRKDWGPRNAAHTISYRVNAGPLGSGSWYAQSAREGSRFVGEGCHFVDTVSWWLDSVPCRVTAAAAGDDPDDLSVMLSYEDGSLVTVSYLTKGDPRVAKERIEIFGDGKTACFENFLRFDLWSGARRLSRKHRGLDKGQKGELRAFIGAVKAGTAMPIDFASLVATTAATLAVSESIGSGGPIELSSWIRSHTTRSLSDADFISSDM
jgi:predicted dehydrogenase/threonine dehydrogenase-like Zn-dependent dehydrogenase